MTDSILIVDDSTFIVEGLVALLKKAYTPIPSFGGEECLEILRTVTPSLIILDILMEPMDGWETLARIKNNPKTRHIPVLMFSAKKISPEEAEAHRIIIDDFLTKPVNPKKLIEAIEKVLARQESNKRITGSWMAAGVSSDIIEEYLSLKTNLDVDASLLSVMNKQLEMAYPDEENKSELERSIAALEARIDQSRASLESFCREKGGILQRHNDHGDIVPLPVTGPDAEPDQPAPAGIPVGTPATGSPPTDTFSLEPATTVQKPFPVLPSPSGGDAKPAAGHAGPVNQKQPVAPPSEPSLVPEASNTASNTPKITPPAPEIQPAIVPAREEKNIQDSPPATGPAKSSSMAPGSAQSTIQRIDDSLFEPVDKPYRAAPSAQPKPVSVPQDSGVPPVVPGVRDEHAPPAVQPGSGTRTPSMQAPATTRRVPTATKVPARDPRSDAQPEAPSGGFFSRLIAAITRLFTKKRA